MAQGRGSRPAGLSLLVVDISGLSLSLRCSLNRECSCFLNALAAADCAPLQHVGKSEPKKRGNLLHRRSLPVPRQCFSESHCIHSHSRDSSPNQPSRTDGKGRPEPSDTHRCIHRVDLSNPCPRHWRVRGVSFLSNIVPSLCTMQEELDRGKCPSLMVGLSVNWGMRRGLRPAYCQPALSSGGQDCSLLWNCPPTWMRVSRRGKGCVVGYPS